MVLDREHVIESFRWGLSCSGWLAGTASLPLSNRNLYLAALAIYRELGDSAHEAITLKRLGDVSYHRRMAEPSLPFYTEALALSQELGDRAQEALLLSEIGGTYQRVEYMKPAFQAYSEALPIYREQGDRASEAITLYNMAV